MALGIAAAVVLPVVTAVIALAFDRWARGRVR